MLWLKRRRLLNTIKNFMVDTWIEAYISGINVASNAYGGSSKDNITLDDVKNDGKYEPLVDSFNEEFDKKFKKGLMQEIKTKDDPQEIEEWEKRGGIKSGKNY